MGLVGKLVGQAFGVKYPLGHENENFIGSVAEGLDYVSDQITEKLKDGPDKTLALRHLVRCVEDVTDSVIELGLNEKKKED